MALLSYQRYTADFESQSALHTHQTLEQLSINMDNYLDELFNLSLSTYNSMQVVQALEDQKPLTPLEKLYKERLIEGFLDQMIVTPRIDILRVYLIADEVYTGGRYRVNPESLVSVKSSSWYKEALQNNRAIYLPRRAESTAAGTVNIFSIVKKLGGYNEPGKVIGVLRVDANYNGIQYLCDRIDMGEDGGIFVIDESGEIIYSSIDGIDHRKIAGRFDSNPISSTYEEEGRRYLTTTSTVSRMNWKIVSVQSLQEINRGALQTRNFTLLIALICSILASLLSYLLLRGFLRPLFSVVSLMKEVKKGNMTVRFPEHRKDEIGYLGASFNSMVLNVVDMMERNQKLAKEVFESKLLEKEAQLSALISQIRPHFINNTLNTVSVLIQNGKDVHAVQTINGLSKILRSMMKADRHVTVRDELDLLKAYLLIQHNRYGDRLAYDIRVDASLQEYMIPALTLQPIVENSVIHGCETKREKTTIIISGRVQSDFLIIRVEDDGSGMTPEQLESLEEKLTMPLNANEEQQDRTSSNGIGLFNVHKRLTHQFGLPHGLKVWSRLGEGTVVELMLPLNRTIAT